MTTTKTNYAVWYKKLKKIMNEATNIIENSEEYCPTIKEDLKLGYEPQIRVFNLKDGKKVKTKTGFSTKVENLYFYDGKKVESFNFPTIIIKDGKIKSSHIFHRPSRSGLRMIFHMIGNKYVPVMADNYDDYSKFIEGVSQYQPSLNELTKKFKSKYGTKTIKASKLAKRSAREIKNEPLMPKSSI